MTTKKQKYQIPSPGFVRAFAVLLLVIDTGVVAVVLMNFPALGWPGAVALIAALASSYFPIMGLKTGKPEWVLLDLISPF